MKKLIAAGMLLSMSFTPVFAQCFGTSTYYTCTDASGNTYNVSKYGNTTSVQGSNLSTGSNWSQNSNTVGNTTYTQGTASNGQSWNENTITSGGITTQSGTDSNGQLYSRTCTQYGCN